VSYTTLLNKLLKRVGGAILSHPRVTHRPAHAWIAGGVFGASLFSMVAAFGTVADNRAEGIPRKEVVERLALPPVSALDSDSGSFVREDRIRNGDTADTLMQRLGIADPAALDFLRQDVTAQIMFRQLSPGKNLSVRTDIHGYLHSLNFPLNGGDMLLMVERSESGFSASRQPLSLETQIVMKSAEIRHSLFGASDAAGIPDAIATQLADIFGGEIDFHRDLRKGDRFTVIYESFNHQGHAVRTGRILAAEFINDGATYRAAWFQDAGGYYTDAGKNIRKAFLRSPLEFSRITSGFTSARFHPVLQTWRAHRGIDYGAPTGARIKATGDGLVEFAGVKGGYGKAIVLRHQGRYTTLYGHLSGFAKGLRAGSRVAQGDIIGYVGATGLASGPHLHYEFRVNEVHQNPLAMVLPESPPLTAQQLAAFKQKTAQPLEQLGLLRGLNIAQLD
jgi:murein DD-endopeptidase MepM/ murein hydrolase activator NlpD